MPLRLEFVNQGIRVKEIAEGAFFEWSGYIYMRLHVQNSAPAIRVAAGQIGPDYVWVVRILHGDGAGCVTTMGADASVNPLGSLKVVTDA